MASLDIRKVLKMYDDVPLARPRLAITMLQEVTKCISTQPAKYLDLEDEAAEAWTASGGKSYSENFEFAPLVCKRWIEVLSKPGARHAQTGPPLIMSTVTTTSPQRA